MDTHSGHSHGVPSYDPRSGKPWIKNKTLLLAIGALGVVYGDIGTSPLYTIKQCFYGMHAIELTKGNVYGVMSLVFWSLTFVISVKYVNFILRADNHGEGGIFALLGLISADPGDFSSRLRSPAVIAGILGAGLLYGDGVITPAISVLSAIEGLSVATEAASPLVLPLHLSGPVRAVLLPAPGHLRNREGLRPGDDRVVRRHRRSWSRFHCAGAAHPPGDQPHPRL